MKKHLIYFFGILCMFSTAACTGDFLDQGPSNSVDEEELLGSVEGCDLALNGVYRYMYLSGSHETFGEMAINLALDLRGEDIVMHAYGNGWFTRDYGIQFSRREIDARPNDIWGFYYHLIFQVNQVLKYIDTAIGDEELRREVKGQALAIRAYSHHRLVQVFQHTYVGNENASGIPIRTRPTFESLGRSTVAEVYEQIEQDYEEAIEYLQEINRYHPSHLSLASVMGLKARVHLVKNEWKEAADLAREAIQVAEQFGFRLMQGVELHAGFSNANHPEALWALAINGQQTTFYASFFSHMDPFAGGYATIGSFKKATADFLNLIGNNDYRKGVFFPENTAWGNMIIPKFSSQKFRLPTYDGSWEGDYLLMRMAELYLIQAEGFAHAGDHARSLSALNALLRTRIQDHRDIHLTGQELVDEILKQRRVEFWGEGHRYFDMMRNKEDLKRSNAHDPGLAQITTMEAGANGWLMQIPQSELDANTLINASDQNPL